MTFLNRRKKITVVTTFLLIIISCGILTTTIAEDSPKYGGTFIIGLYGEPDHLNAGVTYSITTGYVGGQIYNSLVDYDHDLNPVPDVAESWDVSDDGMKYTFHLVEDATWHDGEPFTSADVKFSFEEVGMVYHARCRKNFAELITSIETPDDYTVVFNLNKPFPLFIKALNIPYSGAILPKHLYEGTDVMANPHNNEPIGTGPYMFKEWVRGSHVTVVRNPNYFKEGLPYLDKIIFKIVTDSAARALAFEKGEIDYLGYFSMPELEFERLSALDGVRTEFKGTEMYATMVTMGFNVRNEIPGNVKVREAIAYLIDKDYLIEKATAGLGLKAETSVPPSLTWAVNNDIVARERNVSKANQLLDEAGYPAGPDGIRFTLPVIYETGRSELSKAGEIIREYLKDGGIEFELRPLDRATFRDVYYIQWDWECSLVSAGYGFDPSLSMASSHSRNLIPIPEGNAPGYTSPRLDEIIDALENELDPEVRLQYFQEAQEIKWNNVSGIPIWEKINPKVIRDDYKNVLTSSYHSQRYEYAYWVNGHDYSPEDSEEAVAYAETKIAELQGNNYDVETATKKLNEAKTALQNLDYTKAVEFAEAAPALSIAPPPETPDTPTPSEPEPKKGIDIVTIGIGVVAIAALAFAYMAYQKK